MRAIVCCGPAVGDAIAVVRAAVRVSRINRVGPDDLRDLVDRGVVKPLGRSVDGSGVLLYGRDALIALIELARQRDAAVRKQGTQKVGEL